MINGEKNSQHVKKATYQVEKTKPNWWTFWEIMTKNSYCEKISTGIKWETTWSINSTKDYLEIPEEKTTHSVSIFLCLFQHVWHHVQEVDACPGPVVQSQQSQLQLWWFLHYESQGINILLATDFTDLNVSWWWCSCDNCDFWLAAVYSQNGHMTCSSADTLIQSLIQKFRDLFPW